MTNHQAVDKECTRQCHSMTDSTKDVIRIIIGNAIDDMAPCLFIVARGLEN